MKFRLHVTEKDIKEGERKNCHRCPISRALNRKFPNADVAVGTFRFRLNDTWYTMPESAKWFISKFDSGYIGSELLPIHKYSFTFDLNELLE